MTITDQFECAWDWSGRRRNASKHGNATWAVMQYQSDVIWKHGNATWAVMQYQQGGKNDVIWRSQINLTNRIHSWLSMTCKLREGVVKSRQQLRFGARHGPSSDRFWRMQGFRYTVNSIDDPARDHEVDSGEYAHSAGTPWAWASRRQPTTQRHNPSQKHKVV
jgi:hypothetical protein